MTRIGANSATRIRSSSRLTARIEHQVRQRGERDDEGDRQPQVAADLRQDLGEVDFAEFRFERRVEPQARKAALQLQGVRRRQEERRQTLAAGLFASERRMRPFDRRGTSSAPARTQDQSWCWRRSRASLMKRRQTS